MNKLALALLLALAVAGGWLLFTCVPFVQEKATWTLAYIINTAKPLYATLQANPLIGPTLTTITSLVGAKLFYSNAMNQLKAESQTKENELTNNLVQTSGANMSLNSTNESLTAENTQLKAENTALKANDPTNHYETLLAQADKEIVRLRDNVSNLNTQIAQMKIAVKTVVA